MKVPIYKSQTALTPKTGSGQLSVRANPGQFAQTGQAMAEFGQVAQKASLNALSAAQKTKLTFDEMDLRNKYEAEKEKALLEYNKGLVDFQIQAKTQDPNKADKYFEDKALGLEKKLVNNFTSEAAKKDFLSKSQFDYLNRSVSVRTSSASRRIDDQASVYVARVEQLENMAVTGNTVQKMAALSLLHGKDGIFEKLVGLGYWTKTNGEVKKAASKENILKNTITNDFQNKQTLEEKKAYLETLEKNPPTSLGVIGTRTIISNLRSDITRAEAVVKKEATVLKADIVDLKDMIKLGVPIDKETYNSFEAKAKKQGSFGADNLQSIKELKLTDSILSRFKKENPYNIINEITEYEKNGIPGVGRVGKDTLLEGEIIESAKTLAKNMQTQLKSDPLTFASRVGVIDLKNINFTSTDSTALMASRIGKAQAVSGTYGSELKLLTETEADVLKNLYNNPETSYDIKLATVTNIVKGFGSKYSQNVFEELSMKGATDLAHVGGLMIQGNISAATYALKGIDLINKGVKPVDYTATTTSGYYETLGPALSELDSSVENSGVNIVKQIYTALASEAGASSFDDTLFAKAIQLAFGGTDKGTGGIQEVNGVQTLVPPQLNSIILEEMLDNIDAGQIMDMSGMSFDKSITNGINNGAFKLYAVGEGVYKFGRGTKGTETFRWAATADGAELEIDAIKYYETYGVRK